MVSLALHIGNVWQTVNKVVTTTLPKRHVVQRPARGFKYCQWNLTTEVAGS